MKKKHLEWICIILVGIILGSIVGGYIYVTQVTDQKQKAANRMTYSAYRKIDNALNLTTSFHKNNNTGENNRIQVNYMMNLSISSLRHAEKLYNQAGMDHSNLNETINSVIQLRFFVNEYWGKDEKILPVMKNITLIYPPDRPNMKTVSYYQGSFDGEYVDFSEEIMNEIRKQSTQ